MTPICWRAEVSGNWWQWPEPLRGKRFARKKAKKEWCIFISSRTDQAAIHPLLGPYIIKMAGASSTVSELKVSWASRGFVGRRCHVRASWAGFSESSPSLLVTFRQSRFCYSVLQTFIPWKINGSCTLQPFSASMHGEFQITTKDDPGTSMLVYLN